MAVVASVAVERTVVVVRSVVVEGSVVVEVGRAQFSVNAWPSDVSIGGFGFRGPRVRVSVGVPGVVGSRVMGSRVMGVMGTMGIGSPSRVRARRGLWGVAGITNFFAH